MSGHPENYIRWEPVPDVPETPCADFFLESQQMGKLKVVARYSQVAGNDARDLLIHFSDVRAFRVYWDGAGPKFGDRPRCKQPRFLGFIWPLLIVENSQWIGSSDFAVSKFIAETSEEELWRHFQILTLERHTDILARGAITAEWVTSD